METCVCKYLATKWSHKSRLVDANIGHIVCILLLDTGVFHSKNIYNVTVVMLVNCTDLCKERDCLGLLVFWPRSLVEITRHSLV